MSPATVDRVLGGGGVTPDKERRVLDGARRLKLDRVLDQRAARTLRVALRLQPPVDPFQALLQAEFEAANRAAFGHLNLRYRIDRIDPRHPAATVKPARAFVGGHDALVI